MSIAEGVAIYLVQVVITTIVQLLTLFGPGLILVALLSILARYVTRLAYTVIGSYLYLLLFGWLGTAVHESGHALFAMLFGYRIAEVNLFKPDASTGSLGHVRAGRDANSLFQHIGLFFFGIGPILFGTSMIFIALLILFQNEMIELMRSTSVLAESAALQPGLAGLFYQTLAYCGAILRFIFSPEHLADWRFYVFLYLTFAIGSSIRLSDSDIKAATSGFIVLIIIVLFLNLATLWQGGLAAGSFDLLSQSYAFFYVILALTLALNLLAALILFVPALVLGRR